MNEKCGSDPLNKKGKRNTELPQWLWCVIFIIALASGICATGYYLAQGIDLLTSILSGAIIFVLCTILLIILVGALLGAIEPVVKKGEDADKPDCYEKNSANIGQKEGAYTVETYYVVGTQYYDENIKKLAVKNVDWSKNCKAIISQNKARQRIYRYTYINKPVKLIPEPHNKHDRNAVMVQIAGEKVGYISRDENLHIKEILSAHDIKHISAFIGGGQFKIVTQDGVMEKGESNLSVNVRICYR